MAGAFGTNAALDVIGDQVRRNTEMFEQAMRMFLPFGAGERPAAARPGEEKGKAAAGETSDIDALRRQLDEMQKRLDKLGKE